MSSSNRDVEEPKNTMQRKVKVGKECSFHHSFFTLSSDWIVDHEDVCTFNISILQASQAR